MHLPMQSPLPDVASSEPSTIAAPLQWVGMDGIALPIRLCDAVASDALPAQAALHVDLPAVQVKGIHMSRLYRLLDDYAQQPLVLADLVLCAPVIAREAKEQRKTLAAHYAHMVVHGTLHAQGWDHETGEADAEAMEAREIEILAGLGLRNPY
jgi:rRNA maturation RNase YbeY